MSTIKWSQIEAECGDFRDGFVATFRKYEGQDTDEKDEQGRTVKVTMASFARHMSIPRQTFNDWVDALYASVSDEERAAALERSRRANERSVLTRMTPERKAEVAREFLAEPEVAEQVVDDPETRLEVHKALDRQYDRRRPEPGPETTQENPHEAEADAYRLLTKLRAVDRALTDAAVLAQNMRGIGARDAAALEPVVERLRGLLDLISSGLSGAPLDVELRALLDAEAGS